MGMADVAICVTKPRGLPFIVFLCKAFGPFQWRPGRPGASPAARVTASEGPLLLNRALTWAMDM